MVSGSLTGRSLIEWAGKVGALTKRGRIVRTRSVVAALVAILSITWVAQAQEWPNRPVRIVSPFAPGGGSDTVGRIIAEYLSERMGQQFVVENRGGAGGLIGSAAVAKSPPDGYTFVISSIATHVIAPITVSNAGYDPIRDFTHVAFAGGPPTVIVAHPSLGVKSFKELVALLKSRAEPMDYVSPGPGTLGNLMAEYWAEKRGRQTHPCRLPRCRPGYKRSCRRPCQTGIYHLDGGARTNAGWYCHPVGGLVIATHGRVSRCADAERVGVS